MVTIQQNFTGDNNNNYIMGTMGNDLIEGLGGNDLLYGKNGNDTINAGVGDDYLFGGMGNDSLVGGEGNDSIYTNTGNDTVIGGAGIDFADIDRSTENGNINFSYTDPNNGNIQGIETLQVTTGSGNDIIVSTAAISQIYTNKGNDAITTGSGHDYLSGGDGNDTIDAGAGDDFLFGGDGNDSLVGGDGNDTLHTGTGNDTIVGGTGEDSLVIYRRFETNQANISYTDFNSGDIREIERVHITTGSGNDTITSTAPTYTGDYANEIYTFAGNDLITTGSGKDSLDGGDGNDTIDAGAGDDQLHGGAGNDSLVGGEGNDRISTGAGRDTVSGGAGYDDLTIDCLLETNAVNISYTDLNSGQIQGIERVQAYTGSGNDTIVSIVPTGGSSTAAANIIYTYVGQDSITTGSGFDHINGGEGNDTIVSGAGNDTIYGSFDNDLITSVNPLDTAPGKGEIDEIYKFYYRGGSDKIILADEQHIYYDDQDITTSGASDYAKINNFDPFVDQIQLQASASLYRLDVSSGSAYLYIDKPGSEPDEQIAYITGNLTGLRLSSRAFTYTINLGNATDDLLVGGVGDDTLNGQEGNDTMIGGTGNDTYFVDSVGDVITELTNEGIDTVNASLSYNLGANLENLTLLGTADLNGTGNSARNILTGNSGHNILMSQEGNDLLNGGKGNDTLVGGGGSDRLTGGEGQDEFVFNAPSEKIDRITDFQDIDDTIVISATGFGGGLTAGTLVPFQLTIGTSATTVDHRLIYNPNTGGLFFDVDGVGGTTATQFATLTTKPTLTSVDFLVI